MLEKILVKEVVAPIIIVASAVVIYFLFKAIIQKVLNFKTKKHNKRQKTFVSIIVNIVKYFIMIIALLMILEVFHIDTKSIVASLGVVGLVLGLALQDLLKDFISGMTIIFEDQFGIGDTVTIGGFTGEVVYLGLKTTKIKAFTGEIKILANRNITEVINLSVENSLAIVDIGVDYHSDLDKVEKTLTKLCTRLSAELTDLKGEVTLVGVQSLDASSVTYRVTALTSPMQHYGVQRQIRKEIVEEFNKQKIEIPFPQMVIHNG